MGKNIVRELITDNTSWVCPAGVYSVKAYAVKKATPGGVQSSVISPFNGLARWGNNANGQLGVGDVTSRSSPVSVLGGLKIIQSVTGAGNSQAYQIMLTDGGAAYGVGANTRGQLGVGDVTARSSPVAVLGGLQFQELVIAELNTTENVVGLAINGSAYAWGVNGSGELGVGDVTPRSSPVAVLGGLKFQFLKGLNPSGYIGRATDNVTYAWGGNTAGALGVGDVTPRSSPVAVLGGLTFSQIIPSVLNSSVFGLTSDGTAYAWGLNTNGQLGVGDVTARSSPVAVLGGLKFKKIVAYGGAVVGLTTSNVAYAWGLNANGQLGVGDVIPRSSPVAVLGGLSFVDLAYNINAFFGFTSDGSVYAMGNNTNGGLGVGDTTPRSSPVAVLGGLKFIQITPIPSDYNGVTGSTISSLAFTPDGTMYAWGQNAQGVLGVGDTTARSSPTAVLGSFIGKSAEVITEKSIEVTPGTTYTITFRQFNAVFGATAIGSGRVDNIVLEYSA